MWGRFKFAAGRVFSAYDRSYERSPIVCSGLTMAVKAGVCDTIAQKLTDWDAELDVARIGKFTLFCVGYVGSFQHVIFNVIYPRLFRGMGIKVAIQMSLFDNFVHSPLVYLPTYYSFKSVSDGGSILDGLKEYSEDGLDVLKACWGVWVPAQFVNFWLVPKNFRILYIAAVGSLWEVILSSLAPMALSEAAETPAVEPNEGLPGLKKHTTKRGPLGRPLMSSKKPGRLDEVHDVDVGGVL